jgi:hypothetical protein
VAGEGAAETVGPGGRAAVRLLRVWCDMDSDGGGYTIVPVQGGLPTASYTTYDTCEAMGLQVAVPRTRAHLAAMLQGDYVSTPTGVHPGLRYIRRVLPGVVSDHGFALPLPLTFAPMTSTDKQATRM